MIHTPISPPSSDKPSSRYHVREALERERAPLEHMGAPVDHPGNLASLDITRGSRQLSEEDLSHKLWWAGAQREEGRDQREAASGGLTPDGQASDGLAVDEFAVDGFAVDEFVPDGGTLADGSGGVDRLRQSLYPPRP